VTLPAETEYCAVPTHRTSTDPTRAASPRAGPFRRSPAARNTARLRFRRAAVTSGRATTRFPHSADPLPSTTPRWLRETDHDSAGPYPLASSRVPSSGIGRLSYQPDALAGTRRVGELAHTSISADTTRAHRRGSLLLISGGPAANPPGRDDACRAAWRAERRELRRSLRSHFALRNSR